MYSPVSEHLQLHMINLVLYGTLVMVIDLLDVVSKISSLRVQVTSAEGSPMILAYNLTISPADTVMSFNLVLSILGGINLGLASLKL